MRSKFLGLFFCVFLLENNCIAIKPECYIGVHSGYSLSTALVKSHSSFHQDSYSSPTVFSNKLADNNLLYGGFGGVQFTVNNYVIGVELNYHMFNVQDNAQLILATPTDKDARARAGEVKNFYCNVKHKVTSSYDVLLKLGCKLQSSLLYLKVGPSFTKQYFRQRITGPELEGTAAIDTSCEKSFYNPGYKIAIGVDLALSKDLFISTEYSHCFFKAKKIRSEVNNYYGDTRAISNDVNSNLGSISLKIAYKF